MAYLDDSTVHYGSRAPIVVPQCINGNELDWTVEPKEEHRRTG